MKVTISLNGVSIKKDIPTSWDEVSFKDFLELEKAGKDHISAISLFTGMDYETLCRSKIMDMDTVMRVLGFLFTPAVPVVPKTILKYTVPKNLEFEQVQMYIDLKNYVNESASLTPLEQLERYALYCAVYTCSQPYGKYSWEYAEQMKDEFLTAPCTEVLGIGNFTLLKLIGSKAGIDLTSPKVTSLRMKLKLVLISWRIRMVLFLRSFNLRKKLV